MCEDTTFNVCQNDICRNTNVFPSSDYPNHATLYIGSDDCCTRRCHWAYRTCSYGQIGCLNDEDCAAGLYCNKQNGDNLAFCDNSYCNKGLSDSTSYTWYAHNGQCYGVITSSKSWTSAKYNCRNLGGDLAKVNSLEDQTRLIRIRTGGFWIGGTDEASEGTWKWADGSSMTYTGWGGSNPDGGTYENCVFLYNNYWGDYRCSSSQYSMCQVKVRTG